MTGVRLCFLRVVVSVVCVFGGRVCTYACEKCRRVCVLEMLLNVHVCKSPQGRWAKKIKMIRQEELEGHQCHEDLLNVHREHLPRALVWPLCIKYVQAFIILHSFTP